MKQSSRALNNDSKNIDILQIERLEQLYDFYINVIFHYMLEILYIIKSYPRIENFLNFNIDMNNENRIKKTGKTLQTVFEISLQQCDGLK
jgi:hypothetical protein